MSSDPLLAKAKQKAVDVVVNLSDKLRSAAGPAASEGASSAYTGLTTVPGIVLRREAKSQCHVLWPNEYTARDLPADAVPRVPGAEQTASEEKKKCCGRNCASVGECLHDENQVDDADVIKMPVRFEIEERSKAFDAALCGPWRKAEIIVKSPTTDATLFSIERPQRCGPLYPSSMSCFCGMYPCCGCLLSNQEMEVHDADGKLIGTILEVFTPGCTCYCCKRSEIEIRDADDQLLFLLRSAPLGLCHEPLGPRIPHPWSQAYGFEILEAVADAPRPPASASAVDALGEALKAAPPEREASASSGPHKRHARRTVTEFEETGCSILNMWAGVGSWRAMPWSACNNVKVQFPEGSGERHRALLMAAGLFLDYTYFARVPQLPIFQGLLYLGMCRPGCTDHIDPDPVRSRYYS